MRIYKFEYVLTFESQSDLLEAEIVKYPFVLYLYEDSTVFSQCLYKYMQNYVETNDNKEGSQDIDCLRTEACEYWNAGKYKLVNHLIQKSVEGATAASTD